MVQSNTHILILKYKSLDLVFKKHQERIGILNGPHSYATPKFFMGSDPGNYENHLNDEIFLFLSVPHLLEEKTCGAF